jgi:hypothetical protein
MDNPTPHYSSAFKTTLSATRMGETLVQATEAGLNLHYAPSFETHRLEDNLDPLEKAHLMT